MMTLMISNLVADQTALADALSDEKPAGNLRKKIVYIKKVSLKAITSDIEFILIIHI